MAQLSTEPMHAVDQPAAADDPTTNARPEGEVDQISISLAGPKPRLAKRSAVAVVANRNRPVARGREEIP